MHVRVRVSGKPGVVVLVESKLTKIDKFRDVLHKKFGVKPNLQRLLYGGKLLENGYTFHDYNIKINEVIQLMVRAEPSPEKETTKITPSENEENEEEETETEYEDAVSMMYAVGDHVDMRDKVHGAWFEGRIDRIVRDPSAPRPDIKTENKDRANKENEVRPKKENKVPPNKESDRKMKQPPVNRDMPKNGKEMSFGKAKQKSSKMNVIYETEDHLLFAVHIRGDVDDSYTYCKLKDIRPRARNVIKMKDLQVGQRVMVNYNFEHPYEIGYWYDFEMSGKVHKTRFAFDLIGTIYFGPESIAQNDTKVRLHSSMFLIEEVIPLESRTDEYKDLMQTQTEKRSLPLNCLKCRDEDDVPCKDCGCFTCSGKEVPERILLCDECNRGFHMHCLRPPLSEVPVGDWYCRTCKRDPKAVVAPGAAKQMKRQTSTNRDWGRGMACVGKTKTCSMPANHFGPIPGIEVGMCWRFRIQLSESGVHRPPVSGIHGRDGDGAYSIVLSGGYEDDVDNGNEFTYTGSGGRDLSGNKRTAGQSCEQKLTRENKALARNCAVKQVNEKGDDAGENWREGKPVRVMRSFKMMKHFPKYAPKEGVRYDGIYKVVKYYTEIGKAGFRVWKYLLRRDDPCPAPWEPGAKHYDIVYPDGYLEAEAEKKALKEANAKPKGKQQSKKRALQDSIRSENEETMPLPKKTKAEAAENTPALESPTTSPKATESEPQPGGSRDGEPSILSEEEQPGGSRDGEPSILSEEEQVKIAMDTMNAKLWEECFKNCRQKGKKEFVEHMTAAFLCIICQEIAANPVTTACLHNFCMKCLKQAFKAAGTPVCPCCRSNVSQEDLGTNDQLQAALRAVMSGYDTNRK